MAWHIFTQDKLPNNGIYLICLKEIPAINNRLDKSSDERYYAIAKFNNHHWILRNAMLLETNLDDHDVIAWREIPLYRE